MAETLQAVAVSSPNVQAHALLCTAGWILRELERRGPGFSPGLRTDGDRGPELLPAPVESAVVDALHSFAGHLLREGERLRRAAVLAAAAATTGGGSSHG